jgi:hypothetical protein
MRAKLILSFLLVIPRSSGERRLYYAVQDEFQRPGSAAVGIAVGMGPAS